MAVEGISGVAAQSMTMTPVAPAPQVTAASTSKKVAEQPEAEIRANTQGKESSKEATDEKIRKAVEKLNGNLGKAECRYSFHEQTNRVMIRLVDKETEEVIKEFPAEDTLNMIAKAWELAGLLVDEKL
ncbi:MAG: flagellar protein FlaG [Lachnospiraceae bacterium]|nr:flagellar protein FlaG [Lachnospiraceae bacterium]